MEKGTIKNIIITGLAIFLAVSLICNVFLSVETTNISNALNTLMTSIIEASSCQLLQEMDQKPDLMAMYGELIKLREKDKQCPQ